MHREKVFCVMLPKSMVRTNISRKKCLWLKELNIEHPLVIPQDTGLQKDVVGEGILHIRDKNT